MQIITPQQGETMRESRSQTMRSIGEQKVRELVVEKRRLVEVPYTATLADTMNTLVANRVMAVPVAAPPGHWIGAGGSMIMETDKHTGAVRKHYIGMVTMLDILAHLAEDDNDVVNGGDSTNNNDVDKKLGVTVSTIIGHCLEGLSLWTLNPNTSLLDCMEVFSKGIHRAMVPLDSNMDNISGVELVESSSCYRMLTQMDVIKYLKSHAQQELRDVMARTVRSTGAVTDTILAVTHRTRAIDAIKCLRSASLQAVPIVDASDVPTEGDNQLINGYGMKIVGTFSATDIRGCPVDLMQSWLPLNVREFMAKVYRNPSHGAPDLVNSPKLLVSCYADSSLLEVIDKVTTKHVHRVWVLDEYNYGTILGVISLTDIIRAVRAALISAS
ncbi:SNF1-related protein kinase regulatory subunit gamma-like PV42a [Spinacia oleracea]|uniref:SNF1-related protein kinase regulatory subunit gamma-like PV42a n=1 Tax=Spinacia oleracea TaxID=3562 RepID=A0A9R0JRH3_SPIOL|nr:SNF1-related protein kinase regulatory subunit gamma-like PV42a [Spinacia oleracea]